jgi:hypothetical protein
LKDYWSEPKIGNAHSSINDLIASWKQRECTTMHNMKVACNFFAIWKPHLFNVFNWFMILNFEDELVQETTNFQTWKVVQHIEASNIFSLPIIVSI